MSFSRLIRGKVSLTPNPKTAEKNSHKLTNSHDSLRLLFSRITERDTTCQARPSSSRAALTPRAIEAMHDDAAWLLASAKERGLDTTPGAWTQSRAQAAHHETRHAIINAAQGVAVTNLSIFRT